MDRPQLIGSPIAYSRAACCLLRAIAFYIIIPTADATSFYLPLRVEVFATTALIVAGEPAIRSKEPNQDIDLQVYELNGIQLVEAELSKDLSDDSDQSKRVTLRRIQMLDDQVRTRMRQAAMGLASAVRYGIDRFPAIVFDGQAVVYGVTDLQAALDHYRKWRNGTRL